MICYICGRPFSKRAQSLAHNHGGKFCHAHCCPHKRCVEQRRLDRLHQVEACMQECQL